MARYVEVHPRDPQPHSVARVADMVREDALIAYPTDSGYALGCRIGDKAPLLRICQIRQLDERHNFTLICRDLSELATYAFVSNAVYRVLRANTPGPYTFILPATRQAPRRLMHPKRKTIGLRVPDHPIANALLGELDEPMLTTSLILPEEEEPLTDPYEIRSRLEHQIDLVLDGGYCGNESTTVVDLTGNEPVVLRVGAGDPSPFR